MEDEMALPRFEDKLFTRDGDWLNACVGISSNQWIGYVDGFKLGAEVLMQYVVDTMSKQDYLVYPIIFLYRQSLELQLKRIFTIGNTLLEKVPDNKVLTQHRLLPLWRECKSIINEVSGGKTPDTFSLDAVENTLREFESRDPVSTTFRYPFEKTGKPSHSASTNINLANFTDVAQRVFNLLDCCSTWFEQLYEDKCEMLAYHRDYHGY